MLHEQQTYKSKGGRHAAQTHVNYKTEADGSESAQGNIFHLITVLSRMETVGYEQAVVIHGNDNAGHNAE